MTASVYEITIGIRKSLLFCQTMSVFLNNIDDFIVPSQACINPLVASKIEASKTKSAEVPSGGVKSEKLVLKMDTSTTAFDASESLSYYGSKEPDLIKPRVSSSSGSSGSSSSSKVASISLNDCLACSGCVTSSETVLIQEQGYEKLLDTLDMIHATRAKCCGVESEELASSLLSSSSSSGSGESADKKQKIDSEGAGPNPHFQTAEDEEKEEDPTTPFNTVVVSISPQTCASFANTLSQLQAANPSSPQIKWTSMTVFLHLARFFKVLGCSFVCNSSAGGDISLIMAREEFIQRYRNGYSKKWDAPVVSTAISRTRRNVYSSSQKSSGSEFSKQASVSVNPLEEVYPPVINIQDKSFNLPMFSSNCPGWVCYAEKSHPHSLPYMATTKSAQQIIGAIFKHILGPKLLQIEASKIYHVSIEPCFDKKLEGSRLDFYDETSESCEVDLVLSTNEVWNLLIHKAAESSRDGYGDGAGADAGAGASASASADDVVSGDVGLYLQSLGPDTLPQSRAQGDSASSSGGSTTNAWVEHMMRCCTEDGELFVRAGESVDADIPKNGAEKPKNMNSGSGGYLEHIARYASETLLGSTDAWASPLVYKQGRNADIAEVEILSSIPLVEGQESGPRKLRFGRAYGFRNIQSIILKAKRGKCDLDFIEVMACPSGCINGGGQLRISAASAEADASSSSIPGGARESASDSQQRIVAVNEAFHEGGTRTRCEDTPLARFLFPHPTPHTMHSSSSSSSFASIFPDGPTSVDAVHLLCTQFHNVPRMEVVAPLAAKW